MGDKQNHKGTLKNSFQITVVVHACNPTRRQETCCEPEDSLSYTVTTSLARAAYKDSVSKIKNKNKQSSQISSPTIQNILCICLGWSLALHLFKKAMSWGDSSVSKTCIVQAWEPEFHPLNPGINKLLSYNPIVGEAEADGALRPTGQPA